MASCDTQPASWSAMLSDSTSHDPRCIYICSLACRGHTCCHAVQHVHPTALHVEGLPAEVPCIFWQLDAWSCTLGGKARAVTAWLWTVKACGARLPCSGQDSGCGRFAAAWASRLHLFNACRNALVGLQSSCTGGTVCLLIQCSYPIPSVQAVSG